MNIMLLLSTSYPVCVCAAGLCVWSCQFVYVCMRKCVCMHVMYMYVDKKMGCLGSYHRKISR